MDERPNRDARGRLLPGHRLPGPGNPRRKRVAELRRAIEAALAPGDYVAIVRKLVELALEGDVVAAKEVLDRGLGKPTAEEVEIEGVDLGLGAEELDAAGLARASARLLAEVQRGAVSAQQAELLGRLLEGARQSLELNELAARIAKLERLAKERDPDA